MPYNPDKNPWDSRASTTVSLGMSGAIVTPSDTEDLSSYARIRVFAPATLASAQIRILPACNDDSGPITLSLTPGVATVLEYIVRRVLATGTTAGLEIHAVL